MTYVQIHPAFNIVFSSHQLLGLMRIFGTSAIRYSAIGFPNITRSIMLVRINDYRLVIDTSDEPAYEMSALEWCDIYAKVNIEPSISPAPHDKKVVVLGPHFPVQLMSFTRSMFLALANFVRYPQTQFREHLANYYRQWRYLLPETDYKPSTPNDDYVFASSAIWRKEQLTNDTRADFIRAVRSQPGIKFEGGLVPRKRNDVPGYEDVYSHGRYAIREYVNKTRSSVIVFNTPAVKQNHSWKLAEYLAMGKAILSTPLVRPVPQPLEHGVHIHYVEPTTNAIRAGVEYLLWNRDYRRLLEVNARHYYETVLKPEVTMRRILEQLFEVD